MRVLSAVVAGATFGLAAYLAPVRAVVEARPTAPLPAAASAPCSAAVANQNAAGAPGDPNWTLGLARISSGCLDELERLGAHWR